MAGVGLRRALVKRTNPLLNTYKGTAHFLWQNPTLSQLYRATVRSFYSGSCVDKKSKKFTCIKKIKIKQGKKRPYPRTLNLVRLLLKEEGEPHVIYIHHVFGDTLTSTLANATDLVFRYVQLPSGTTQWWHYNYSTPPPVNNKLVQTQKKADTPKNSRNA